jgi:putative PIN family toxin of toxin-antitoxin system
MKAKLTIVLDTNVFLVSLARGFKYYWIFEALLDNRFNLCVSNEILTEYEEIIEKRYGINKTSATLDFLLLLPNVLEVTPFYLWQLIEKDKDDNKFVDCAIAGNADYIISNDKHFNILSQIEFPSIEVLKYEDFEKKFKLLLTEK